ncbi:MAG: glycoside hydrolase family 3 C-terminal domain-containing protein [Pseudobutyrivibrio sp.]|nr:glycoside hydrolase family 3 C-terminal domain-containing protein [Pseudobutyrivibrio sp.]
MSITADFLEKIVIVVDVVLAIIAILMIVLLIMNWKKSKPVSKRKNVFRGVVSFILAAVVVGGNIASNIYDSSLNSVFTKPAKPDSSITSTEDEWRGLATEIADEGMVLLKNDNNTLPLAEGTKINLLGYNAWNPLYSGSGSGSVSAGDSVSIEGALTAAGFEVNPVLAVDNSFWPEKPADTNPYGYNDGDLFFGDVDISNYAGDISFENQAAYSNVGIVVIGRSGGEGFDLTALEDTDYLELTQNEKDLLNESISSFDKVIVVLNMANALQMDELAQYDVDAIVWAGLPGPYGFTSLGSILNGTVNPSGSLPDTWVYDNDSNPANENYGDQTGV